VKLKKEKRLKPFIITDSDKYAGWEKDMWGLRQAQGPGFGP